MSTRALLAVVVACTVGIWVVDFAAIALGPDSVRTALEHTARAVPAISLTAVVVLVLLRHQIRSRQLMIADLQRSRLDVDHARRHLALLADGSRAVLANPEDRTVALRVLADVVVPEFADWYAVDLLEEGGLRRVVTAHTSGRNGAEPSLLATHPGWASVVERVMARGEGELGWVGQPTPHHPDDADHLTIMDRLGLVSWMCVPLRLHGESVGAVSFGTAPERRGFRPSDLAAAAELSNRTTVALERMVLYGRAQTAATDAERRARQLRRLVEAALAVAVRPGVQEVTTLVAGQAGLVLGAGMAVVEVQAGSRQFQATSAGGWAAEHHWLLGEAAGTEPGVARPLRDATTGKAWAMVTRFGGEGSHPAGMLAVTHPYAGTFTSDDESLLVLLAQLAAVAVDNAHLYETVRAGEEHLEALLEAAPVSILEFGVDAELRRANTAARRLLGPPGDGVVPAVFHPDTEALFRQIVADTVSGEPVAGAEAQARRADGRELTLALSGAALYDRTGGVDGVLVLAADVTARRALEDQLVRARRIEAVGQVAGGVAHDFNNLLTVVLGHASVLTAVLPPDHPCAADVEAITLAAERAAGITAQLLTISRGDLVTPEVFDPRTRLQRLAGTLRSILPSSVDVVVDVTPGEGCVRMSSAQFDQVVLNLAINARDAMPDGGILTVRLHEEGGAVLLTVADTGSGMDAVTADRCFEPFFTTKGGMRGTGLGLATVQTVVTGAGGELLLQTEPGEGTTFSVRLPRMAADLDEAAPLPGARPGGSAPAGSEHILVVENEDGLRRLVAEVLRAAGYVVTPAVDGVAALVAVTREVPALVVTDVVMPRMGGVALAQRLRDEHPGLPVLFMTGYVDQASRTGMEGADVLLKPFVVDDLVARVGEMLDRPRPNQDDAGVTPAAGQGSNR